MGRTSQWVQRWRGCGREAQPNPLSVPKGWLWRLLLLDYNLRPLLLLSLPGPRGKRVEKEEHRTVLPVSSPPLCFPLLPVLPVPCPFVVPSLPFFVPPTSRPLPLVAHPVPGEATLLLKRGGSFAQLPGVSGRLPGFLEVPTPAAFRSSKEWLLIFLSRRLLCPRTPVSPSSYSRRALPKEEEAVF
ncbi:hypothetical protein NDU88_005165 [Pleurodeles waltl]|uniref:Uncharacterized protein n=1 Tax=Pleurodeles waltl TaxID=8319 RepID=A0AAV7PHS9_PLEWA|nr:hypothetical protein NDU88_005165 [Pleurodeles waltl]